MAGEPAVAINPSSRERTEKTDGLMMLWIRVQRLQKIPDNPEVPMLRFPTLLGHLFYSVGNRKPTPLD